jgi:hypothetical protein
MAKLMSPTKKDSPAIRTGKAPFNKPASDYAPPHTMANGPVDVQRAVSHDVYSNEGMPIAAKYNAKTPAGNVSIGANTEVNMNGEQKMRGAGAAERGFMSRGPMA